MNAVQTVRLLLEAVEMDLELLIASTPTSHKRNFLTEANIHAKLAMASLKKADRAQT